MIWGAAFAAVVLLGRLGGPAPAEDLPLPVPDVQRMLRDVAHLAVAIGPRPGGSEAEHEAASFVAGRFREMGYSVRLQPFPVPGGRRSANVIATRGGRQPLVLIGGHYDSRPGAPGAEDNASGTAVVLEAARLLADEDLPVQFVAFGAEERIGRSRHSHHFGSRFHVRTAAKEHLAGLRGMLCVDCVGGGSRLLIQGRPEDGGRLAQRCRAQARRLGLRPEGGRAPMNSDHEGFARAGVPVAYTNRLPRPHVHTPRDVPERIRPGYLRDAARVVLLSAREALRPAQGLPPRTTAPGVAIRARTPASAAVP